MTNSRSRPSPALTLLLAPCLALPALATGPFQQTMPWQGGGTTRDSIVRIDAGNTFGTGTVICKTEGSDGNLWLGLVTADHVVRPGGWSSWTGSGHSVSFGDNGAQGVFGRVGNTGESWYRQYPGADLAFLAINMGPRNGQNQAFFNNIVEVEYIAVSVDQNGRPAENGTWFTQYGYGNTGTFVAAAGANPAGMLVGAQTGEKRFQNNEITGVGWDTGIYAGSPTMTWSFDQPAAAGFLKGEGTAFGGDSGGPYMTAEHLFYQVDPFDRPGATNPNGGGQIGILRDKLFAVHNGSNPILAPGQTAAYGRVSWGTPLLPEYVDWLNAQCSIVPAPGSATILAVGSLLAIRRRRS